MPDEYSTEAITTTLAGVPGVSDLQPGQLRNGGPVVRFLVEGGRCGGVGCFRSGEYVVTVGWQLHDEGEPGHRTFGHSSRRVTTADQIRAGLAELGKQLPGRESQPA